MKYIALVFGMAMAANAMPTFAGTVTTYTDLGTFSSAVGSTILEDFGPSFSFPISTGVLNSGTNLTPSNGLPILPGDIAAGVTFSTAIGSSFFFNIDAGGGFDGGFLDGLGNDGTLSIAFDVAQGAFSFVTNYLMSNFDVTILFSDTSTYSNSFTASGTEMSFFGFASSASDIVSVSVNGTDNNGFDFALDDFRFTTQPTTVPVPAGLPLLAGGLLALGALRRRRSNSAKA